MAAIAEDEASGATWFSHEDMAKIAIRRWKSFGRRSAAKKPMKEQRILDLAKGLKSHFDPESHDPLSHYVALAAIMAKAAWWLKQL